MSRQARTGRNRNNETAEQKRQQPTRMHALHGLLRARHQAADRPSSSRITEEGSGTAVVEKVMLSSSRKLRGRLGFTYFWPMKNEEHEPTHSAARSSSDRHTRARTWNCGLESEISEEPRLQRKRSRLMPICSIRARAVRRTFNRATAQRWSPDLPLFQPMTSWDRDGGRVRSPTPFG